jgi:hypothetical protein
MVSEPSHRGGRHSNEKSPEHPASDASGQSALPQVPAPVPKPRVAERAPGKPSGKSKLEVVQAIARPQAKPAARPTPAPGGSTHQGEAVAIASAHESAGATFVSRVSGHSQLRSVAGRPIRVDAIGLTSGESRLRKVVRVDAVRANERSSSKE